ncbi:MAG: hypothetical protein ABEJ81_00300 [Haloferacaceae archaeon]
MADESHEGGEEHGEHGEADHDEDDNLRVTSPMQAFSTDQVGVGIAVLVVGLAVTFAVPLLFA